MAATVETRCDSCGRDITHEPITIWEWHTLCSTCWTALQAGEPQPLRVDGVPRAV